MAILTLVRTTDGDMPINDSRLQNTITSNAFDGVTINPGYFINESFTEGITAKAGGGQATATVLVSEINRITVCATVSDSVMLPAATPGLDIIVINHGAKSAQVYGQLTETIDDVASATGVSQMIGSVTIYACTITGKWYSNGIGTGFTGAFPTVSFTDAMTALAGGAQAGTAITTVMNRVTTVVTAGDSVQLPVSAPGLQLTVINAAAANSLNVFGQTGDTIDAIAANSPRAVAANKTANFYCTVAGKWHSVLTA